jgi:hypothetical protein
VPDESTPSEVARARVSSAADSALASGIVPEDPHRLPPPTDWWAADAERHLLDKPKFCPMCASSIHDRGGISTEYWTADTRNFMTWCGDCGWFGEVVRFSRVTILEEDH